LEHGAGVCNISVPPIVHIGGPRHYYHAFETKTVKMDRRETGEVDFNTTTKRIEGEEIVALDDVPMIMAISGDVLSVDRSGKRFGNEWGLGFLQPWRGGVEFYSLWTQNRVDKVRTDGFDFVSTGAFISQGGVPVRYPIPCIDDVIDRAVEMGEAYKADTLESLAGKLEIDPAALRETVDAYNGYCRSGIDLDFGKEAKYLRPIEGDGPFYAFLGAPYCYSTAGGLNIDAKLRVLKADGVTPIPGLYAAGTDCLGTLLTEKNAYVTYGGLAQGWAFTSGRLAGINAAAETQ
jgi:fumarate reductase flavoprotein subunit